MRIRLEAKPGELSAKSAALIDTLAKAVAQEAPSLAESLQKAIPGPEAPAVMDYPVLQQGREYLNQAYAKQMKLMLADIGKVLDEAANAS